MIPLLLMTSKKNKPLKVRKVREKLRFEEALKGKHIYELQHDGVVILDAEGRFVYANKAFLFFANVRSIKAKSGNMHYKELLEFEEEFENKIEKSLVDHMRESYREVNLCLFNQYCMKVSLAINSLVNEGGKITGTLLCIQDLSEEWRLHMKYKGIIKELEIKNEQLEKKSKLFKKFVPEDVIHYLTDKKDELDMSFDMVKKGIFSVLFLDIRNFTRISEFLNSDDCVHLVNSVFSFIQPCINKHGGFIDKFLGDGLMALFKWSDGANDSMRAVAAAMDIQKKLRFYNANHEGDDWPTIEMGFGISTGHIIIGMVGTDERYESTAMGNAVNLASRLEQLTKDYKCTTIISEYTLNSLSEDVKLVTRALGFVNVKGFKEKISIHEVFDSDTREIKEEKINHIKATNRCLHMMKHEEYEEALRHLEPVIKDCELDPLPGILHEQILQAIKSKVGSAY